jgi:DnaA family protein
VPDANPQIPLRFQAREDKTFASFVPGTNHQLIGILRQSSEPFIYLWGEAGSGKSHLLQACCSDASARQLSSVYLPLIELIQHPATCLDGLETMDRVCLDDMQAIQGQAEWEAALFHLFNRIRDAGHQLLVSANAPPADIDIKLADLASRMNWGVTLQLQTLGDEDLLQALIARAETLGMQLKPDAGRFMLTRFPRDPQSMWQLLDTLDQASLTEQRKLTIPFLRRFVGKTID